MAHVCSFIVRAAYPTKKPFFVGTFTVPRERTDHETEAAALAMAKSCLDTVMADHFPDGQAPPEVVNVMLGSITFVPDDYEWRRT